MKTMREAARSQGTPAAWVWTLDLWTYEEISSHHWCHLVCDGGHERPRLHCDSFDMSMWSQGSGCGSLMAIFSSSSVVTNRYESTKAGVLILGRHLKKGGSVAPTAGERGAEAVLKVLKCEHPPEVTGRNCLGAGLVSEKSPPGESVLYPDTTVSRVCDIHYPSPPSQKNHVRF